jgi:hypothetical protein
MIAILEIPESKADLGPWLDRVLMSQDLAKVIDELSVVNDAEEDSVSVEHAQEWLGDKFAAVMQSGCGALGHNQLRELLLRPMLLPAIQELALVNGGPYWNHIANASTSRVAVNHLKRSRWWLAFAPLALAASIAVLVGIDATKDQGTIQPQRPSDPHLTRGTGSGHGIAEPGDPWGWNRPDLLNGMQSPRDVSTRLADTLGEWFELSEFSGRDCSSFTLRVNEMWAGCEHVSAESLDELPEAYRTRLRGCVAALQEALTLVLNDLDQPIPAENQPAALEAAKKSVDASVREAIEALCNLN